MTVRLMQQQNKSVFLLDCRRLTAQICINHPIPFKDELLWRAEAVMRGPVVRHSVEVLMAISCATDSCKETL